MVLPTDVVCDPWPQTDGFTCQQDCTGSEDCADDPSTVLDSELDISMSSTCESLCRNQKQTGCCLLKNGIGCSWMPGGLPIAVDEQNSISTFCSIQGIKFK